MVTNQDKGLLIFSKYLPASTVGYCHTLWQEHKFRFIISPKRATKLGDYKYEASSGNHIVTVNGNLNPLSFLTTYLHEVAHLVTFKKYGNRVLPHGKEWKNEFKLLFQPLLNETIIPGEAVHTLTTYLRNPKASSCSDQGLFEIPSQEILKPGEALVKDLLPGTIFKLKKRTFKILEHRRTRALCEDSGNGRKYLVPEKSVVAVIQL